MWRVAEQRPAQLIPGLAARPWHDARALAACRALEAEYDAIRAEALSLLRADTRGGGASPFTAYHSQALACGAWCDVGLFFNGRRNDANAARAPRTAALLASERGGLRRDATSCPFGSAYFSLLRPRTRLKPHCGPTNGRLRAHLALLVPEGDCALRVGAEPPRRWEEGRVLLFDDSFEHDAYNDTDAPRLVLIVDLWHPGLATDQARVQLLDRPQALRYARVVEDAAYENTTQRGH